MPAIVGVEFRGLEAPEIDYIVLDPLLVLNICPSD